MRKQRHRACRLGAVVRQQCEGIVGIELGRTGQQGSLAFLGQQIVEVPLHRATGGAIALQPSTNGMPGQSG